MEPINENNNSTETTTTETEVAQTNSNQELPPQTEKVKFVELSKPTVRNNFLEKLDFIVEILKTAETNEVDENKKKEIQDAILVVEERRNLRKNLRESLRGSVI